MSFDEKQRRRDRYNRKRRHQSKNKIRNSKKNQRKMNQYEDTFSREDDSDWYDSTDQRVN